MGEEGECWEKGGKDVSWLSKKRYLIGLLLPTLIIYTVYIIAPIIMAIGYSFTKYSGIGKATFNGLTNYGFHLKIQ